MYGFLKWVEGLGAWTVNTFNVNAFIDSLQYMGKGMAVILIVTVVLILCVYLLNVATKEKN
ncbi:MAG: hypothetical protein IJD83_00740 [Clostridia bacterium]|nr:hypothetical protein [Clostridia bacterium]